MTGIDYLSPSPPATGVWWDEEATLDAILHQLRLRGEDVDEPRLRGLVPAAGRHINDYLDQVDDLDPGEVSAALQPALERVTIDLYYGIVGDPIGALVAQLLPAKQRWGVA